MPPPQSKARGRKEACNLESLGNISRGEKMRLLMHISTYIFYTRQDFQIRNVFTHSLDFSNSSI